MKTAGLAPRAAKGAGRTGEWMPVGLFVEQTTAVEHRNQRISVW